MAQQPRMPQRPIPYNSRNYLRPGPRAKIINLNAMMSTWGKNQAKYKEGDLFVSKKILQNLEPAESFAEVVGQEKFRKSVKKIVDIVSGTKGEISYMFEGAQGFLDERLVDQNYINHYRDQVWVYYQEKGKTAEEKEEKS